VQLRINGEINPMSYIQTLSGKKFDYVNATVDDIEIEDIATERVELVSALHLAAKYLPAATAKLMTEAATRLDATSAALSEAISQRNALAAENGQMLRLLTDISENHDEYVNQDEYLYAGIPMDYVSEINAYVSRDVEAENPFKETDAFLAEVQAQGVEMFALMFAEEAIKGNNTTGWRAKASRAASEYAEALRDDAAQFRKGVQS
jgi:hypothetical protein